MSSPLHQPPPPLPPLPPPPRIVKDDNKEQSKKHQFVREPVDVEEEVTYLVQPLCKDATNQGKKVLSFVRNVQPVIQDGPMCGLVALSIASQLLDGSIALPDQLLSFAREQGYSKQGEMFSAANLLQIAQYKLNCTGELLKTDSMDCNILLNAITERGAVLVPYDADKDHTPCLARGHEAHWCVLVGFAVLTDHHLPNHAEEGYHLPLNLAAAREIHHKSHLEPSSVYFFARQGKSRHMGLWSYIDLIESNGNLVEVGPKRRNPCEYVIPKEGISKSLCSLVISLQTSHTAHTSPQMAL